MHMQQRRHLFQHWNMIKQTRNNSGYILLLSILILGALGLVIGVFVLSTGLSNTYNIFTVERSYRALTLAESCAEEALEEINISDFTGTATTTDGDDYCVYTVTDQGGENRLVQTTGTVADIVRKIEITIDTLDPEINVVSWEEVVDF